jgi:DNA-binding MarR family transcriptional regulator
MKKISFDIYIIDTLMRDLIGHDRSPSAFVVFVYLLAATNGKRQRIITVSLQEIASDTGLSKSAVQGAVRLLKRRRLIRTQRETVTSRPTYTILSPWRRPRTRTGILQKTKP